ncbi:GIY-YIG catalytic domain-containing protein [Phthorimaea operculella]|nr:GIY-YIG catalytic domain-containing protein [Phthorimaea operculella]
MAEIELVEDFFGVYLLYCLNPKYKGRTYIGYTRDPNRRIMQHNRGTWAGGANRTSNKGPWKMVLIVHGFPNNISALKSEFQFKLRILSEMLNVGPWCRLPLLIRWLEKEYFEDFPPERAPPSHMTTCHGPVRSRNLKKSQQVSSQINIECLLCSKYINESKSKLCCLNPNCELVSHITCLANLFLTPGEYIPIEGNCPFCGKKLKWGDLIRKMKGCQEFTNIEKSGEEEVGDKNDDQSASSDEDVICSQDRGFVDNNSRWLLDCDDEL